MRQFTFNPEWFEGEDEDEEDDWDLTRYRKEQEDADLLAEEERIQSLSLGDQDGSPGVSNGDEE